MIELRFHPDELLSTTLPEYPTFPAAYIAHGEEKRGDNVYNVTTIYFYYKPLLTVTCSSLLCPTYKSGTECISIYYEAKKIYFSAHTRGQGMWVDFNDCEVNDKDDFIIYVALNSHACYPHPGLYLRNFGFSNDYCREGGKRLRFSYSNIIPAFDHEFDDGTKLYKYPQPPPPSASITPFQRFILPLLFNTLASGGVAPV